MPTKYRKEEIKEELIDNRTELSFLDEDQGTKNVF